MAQLQPRAAEGDGQTEAGHDAGEELGHGGLPVEAAGPVASRPAVEAHDVHLPAGGVAPRLPVAVQQRPPQLPRLLSGDIGVGWQKQLEISGSSCHRTEI